MARVCVVLALLLLREGTCQATENSIEGTWQQVTGYSMEGDETAPQRVKEWDMTVTFAGDRMTNRTKFGDTYREKTWRVQFDRTKNPAQIHWWLREGIAPATGIYQVSGDTLKIAWTSGDDKRIPPDALTPCPKDSQNKWIFLVYKRKK